MKRLACVCMLLVVMIASSKCLGRIGNPGRFQKGVELSLKRNAVEAQNSFMNSKYASNAIADFEGYYGVITKYRLRQPNVGMEIVDRFPDGKTVVEDFLREHSQFFKLSEQQISDLRIRSNTHSAPSLNGRYLRVEITQWHQGIRVLGASAQALVAPDGTLQYYRGLLIPGDFNDLDSLRPPIDAIRSVRLREGLPFFDGLVSIVPRANNGLDIYESGVRVGNTEPIFYAKDKILAPGWLIRTTSEHPSFFLVDGETSEIVGESVIERSRLFGSHFGKFCGSPYSDVICDNPFARTYGDPGIPDTWPCYDVNCGTTSDPDYALCCTKSSTAKARIDSEYTGIDGDWTFVDPNDSTHRLSYGNNAFVARNTAPCGTGTCAIGNPNTGCFEPSDFMRCKSPISDHNFTDSASYTNDLSYSNDFLNPATEQENPAAVSNAFYWMNWYHDFLYELGFTEVEKNFQFSNYGRGGEGADGIVFNENFEGSEWCWCGPFSDTPNYSDGDPGAIYLCEVGTYDGVFGADILTHEYQHLVTSRLIGEMCDGSSDIVYRHVRAMSEGWSDYFALTNTNPSVAELQGENWEYGVRRQRYDRTSYDFTDFSGCGCWDDGELWAKPLYDFRNMLMRKFYTIDESKAEQYGKYMADGTVLWGIAQGCDGAPPSFLTERNNILEFDDLYHYPQGEAPNRDIIWKAFAGRGLGMSACVGYCADGVGNCNCTATVDIDGVPSCKCDIANNNSYFTPGLVGDASDTYVAAAFDVPRSARIVENHGYLTPDSSWKKGLSNDGEVTVSLPFCFPFFGNGCSRTLRVGANGGIRFNETSSNISNYTSDFPTTSTSAPHISPMWADWNPGASTTDSNDVYFGCYYVGDDPVTTQHQSYCVISWHNITHNIGGTPSSFQAVLFPSGNIIFRYNTVGYNYWANSGLNKGDGSHSVEPWGNRQQTSPIVSGDSVAFIYDPVAGTYRYERSDTATWLARKNNVTPLTMTDNSESIQDLLFDFPFSSSLDTTYDEVKIGTNGGIRLGDETGEIGYSNDNLPIENDGSTYGHPNLAVFWDDLNLNGTTDGVFWLTSASTKTAAVTWWNVFHRNYPNDHYTMQAVMFDTGDVVYHYGSLATLHGVTVGINDPKDPNEPEGTSGTGVNTIHTRFYTQLGSVGSPVLTANSAHYYFAVERNF